MRNGDRFDRMDDCDPDDYSCRNDIGKHSEDDSEDDRPDDFDLEGAISDDWLARPRGRTGQFNIRENGKDRFNNFEDEFDNLEEFDGFERFNDRDRFDGFEFGGVNICEREQEIAAERIDPLEIFIESFSSLGVI